MRTPSPTAKRVYDAVSRIPKGRVETYGMIAKRAGTSARAVGAILHRNPDPKTIPCHRVVFSDGRLSPGFAFGGIKEHARRLELEGVNAKNGRVDLNLVG